MKMRMMAYVTDADALLSRVCHHSHSFSKHAVYIFSLSSRCRSSHFLIPSKRNYVKEKKPCHGKSQISPFDSNSRYAWLIWHSKMLKKNETIEDERSDEWERRRRRKIIEMTCHSFTAITNNNVYLCFTYTPTHI